MMRRIRCDTCRENFRALIKYAVSVKYNNEKEHRYFIYCIKSIFDLSTVNGYAEVPLEEI